MSWLFYFPVFLLVMLSGAYIQSGRRRLVQTRNKVIFVTLSALFWISTLGNIAIVLYLYFLSRIRQRRETVIDYVLITSMNIGVFIGPVLLWLLTLVGLAIHWHPILLVTLQMFRFNQLTYFFAGIALVFMIEYLTVNINTLWIRRLIQILLMLTLGLQSTRAPALTIYLLALGSIIGVLFILIPQSTIASGLKPLSFKRLWQSATPKRMALFVSVLILGLWVAWSSGEASSTLPTDNNAVALIQRTPASDRTMPIDYMDMAEWLRVNTPLDSLIHFEYQFEDRSGYFRFLTQRSMFYTWMDIHVGQYSPSAEQAAASRKILDAVASTPSLRFGSLIAQYDINYVVMHSGYVPPLPVLDKGQWYVSVPVYSNTHYDIYQVKKMSTGEFMSLLLRTFNLARLS